MQSNFLKWSKETNLVFNPTKTELMITGTKQIERVHDLDSNSIEVNCNEKPKERVCSFKLLGMLTVQHFDWTDHNHINKTVIECFTTIYILKNCNDFCHFM